MSLFGGLLGNGDGRPPAPDEASPEDIQQYNTEFLKHNDIEARPSTNGTLHADQTFYAKAADDDLLGRNTKHKAEFPWLWDPDKGVRWDFDPIQLRNLSQTNTWVGMLVQSITKEVAETPWTIAESEGRVETQKRLSTHPENRVAKQDDDLPDADARRIHDLLMRPNPDDTWQDMVEMWLGDLLEIGSTATVKAFHRSAYDGNEFAAEPETVEPRALQPSAPEVWTKKFHDRTGLLEGFWQFDDHRSPGTGTVDNPTSRARGAPQPTPFAVEELIWSDMTPRTNRRYGIPPTLLVKEFLQSLDLAVTQEQEYLSRGSIPSGAWVFEEWDREEVKEWKEENEENVKGKPHKSLMFAGRGGDVRFEAMSMNFKELEFTERMKWYARVVASAFQVPTAVVGIEPERVNYNTFQGERENFENNTLGPYLQKIERFVNKDLIQPHWGMDYRFEFKPGMSETTRQMISDRVRGEFNSGLRTRNESRREVGLPEVDSDEDGFKDDVVEDVSPEDAGDALGDLVAGKMSKGDNTPLSKNGTHLLKLFQDGANKADPENAMIDLLDELDLFVSAEDPGPDATVLDFIEWVEQEQKVGLMEGNVGDIDVTEPLESLFAGDAAPRWVPVEESAGGDSGNASLRKDEPLRETDDWHEFDVQPGMVETLTEEIADDVRALFDTVLDDDEVRRIIDRLAVDEEMEKSLSALERRLRELFDDADVIARIRRALRDGTADAAREAVENAMDDTDTDPDVDVEAIEAQLRDREVEFADRFVEEMSDDIRQTVGDGWEEGKGTREIAQDIAEQSDINEGWTGAERIARQELHVATGHARSEFAAEIGKVEIWNTSGDGRVRPAHQAMDGTWKRPGDSWVVEYEDRGVQKESVPGASEPGIGCRCGVLLRDRDEVDRGDYAGDGSLN